MVDGLQFGTEEPATQPTEIIGGTRCQKVMPRRVERRIAFKPISDKQCVDVLGGLLGTGDEGDIITHDVGQDTGEQRIMSAAKDEGVNPLVDERLQIIPV